MTEQLKNNARSLPVVNKPVFDPRRVLSEVLQEGQVRYRVPTDLLPRTAQAMIATAAKRAKLTFATRILGQDIIVFNVTK